MLHVSELTVKYQELYALHGVSMAVEQGSLTALIGSNGAGKTTLINTISGLNSPSNGKISWQGKPIEGLPPEVICQLGIVQVPEGRKLFSLMTVEENLDMGAYLPQCRQHLKESKERVFRLFSRLAERKRQLAGSLSGGEQQMLAVGRALMARPKLLMLDEPTLGLAPIMAAQIFETIQDVSKSGITVMLVSQEVLQTFSIATYAYVLENGSVKLQGAPDLLLEDAQIKESYLGL